MSFKGKNAFITGGAQGLGKGYSEGLLEEGAKVFFGDVNATLGEATLKELQERFGADNVHFAAFDVTDHQKFQDAFYKAVSTLGHVDIFINNAGIINEAAWELTIDINLTAVVYGTKLATEHMRKDKGGRGGRVINISSEAGLNNSPVVPIYAATKHAVRAYTCSMALQQRLEDLGVDYGVLSPHAVATNLILSLDDTKANFLQQHKDLIESSLMPVQKVVEGLKQLLRMEKMDGAILGVKKDGTCYYKMQCVAV